MKADNSSYRNHPAIHCRPATEPLDGKQTEDQKLLRCRKKKPIYFVLKMHREMLSVVSLIKNAVKSEFYSLARHYSPQRASSFHRCHALISPLLHRAFQTPLIRTASLLAWELLHKSLFVANARFPTTREGCQGTSHASLKLWNRCLTVIRSVPFVRTNFLIRKVKLTAKLQLNFLLIICTLSMND